MSPREKLNELSFFSGENPKEVFNRAFKYRRVILRRKALLYLKVASRRGNGFNFQQREAHLHIGKAL